MSGWFSRLWSSITGHPDFTQRLADRVKASGGTPADPLYTLTLSGTMPSIIEQMESLIANDAYLLIVVFQEDPYQGDAAYYISLDGNMVAQGTCPFEKSKNAYEIVAVHGAISAGPHKLSIHFVNDAYGGPGQDRNLYVNQVWYNGSNYLPSGRALMSNGSIDLTVG